jgi:hypothetical protein
VKIAVLAVPALILSAGSVAAQTSKSAANPAVPKAVADKLKPIMDRLKFTEPVVEEVVAGQFTRTREVASGVKSYPSLSDFADKPYQARINWSSTTQHTKIYSNREKAEKATDWLPPGRVPGKDNMRTGSVNYNALFYYKEGVWELGEIEWSTGYGPGASTEFGNKTPWSEVLKAEPKRAEKKGNAAVGQEKKPRTEKEIRDELDKAKQRVQELEKELAAVVPAREVMPEPLPDDNFKVGDTYYLFDRRRVGAAVKVLEVVDERSAIVQLEFGRIAYPQKILMITPTKGMADGQYFQDALNSPWKVTGTKKVGIRTVFVMEPVNATTKK